MLSSMNFFYTTDNMKRYTYLQTFNGQPLGEQFQRQGNEAKYQTC